MASRQEALVFQSWIMAKVDQETQFAAGCTEMVKELSSMLAYQFGDCFDFKDDLIVANEVRTEGLNQSASAILQCLRRLRLKRNLLKFQLNFQALVINRLVETAAFVLIDFKA